MIKTLKTMISFKLCVYIFFHISLLEIKKKNRNEKRSFTLKVFICKFNIQKLAGEFVRCIRILFSKKNLCENGSLQLFPPF